MALDVSIPYYRFNGPITCVDGVVMSLLRFKFSVGGSYWGRLATMDLVINC